MGADTGGITDARLGLKYRETSGLRGKGCEMANWTKAICEREEERERERRKREKEGEREREREKEREREPPGRRR